jgi:hypothetical protein
MPRRMGSVSDSHTHSIHLPEGLGSVLLGEDWRLGQGRFVKMGSDDKESI